MSVTLPVGPVPSAIAVFVTVPASTSLCVIVYVAVVVTTSPGASVLGVSVLLVRLSLMSVMFTSVSVTLPVFFTSNVYVITSPAPS